MRVAGLWRLEAHNCKGTGSAGKIDKNGEQRRVWDSRHTSMDRLHIFSIQNDDRPRIRRRGSYEADDQIRGAVKTQKLN
jgi:hypothetical protein